jgi:hypothetical protein
MVGGFMVAMVNIFLLAALDVSIAGERDVLPAPGLEFDDEA